MMAMGLRDLLLLPPPPSSLVHSVSSDRHPLSIPSSSAPLGVGFGVGVGIFPFITAAPCVTEALLPPSLQPPNNGVEEQWKRANKTQDLNYALEESLFPVPQNDSVKIMGDLESSGNGSSCRDCGNKAKKDCRFRRCRTCCKGRGFDCSTHTRSTWVPAARRRQRQMMVVSGGAVSDVGGHAGSSWSSSGGGKRPRNFLFSKNEKETSTAFPSSASIATTSRSFSSTHQDANFKQSLPSKIRAPAVFKCHRVTTINGGGGELAYQAMVNISGHVFVGFLYDQGDDLPLLDQEKKKSLKVRDSLPTYSH